MRQVMHTSGKQLLTKVPVMDPRSRPVTTECKPRKYAIRPCKLYSTKEPYNLGSSFTINIL